MHSESKWEETGRRVAGWRCRGQGRFAAQCHSIRVKQCVAFNYNSINITQEVTITFVSYSSN
ncbi:MAG: hypothetical protein ACTSRX_00215 [Promethearchaeota archaeon]